MSWFIRICVTMTAVCLSLPAQSVTLGGVVTDSISSAPMNSALVEIRNNQDPNFYGSVLTNAQGAWSYTIQVNSVDYGSAVPFTFALRQNYPNPFNPSTVIPFSIPQQGTVRLFVHNILGQEIDQRSFDLAPGEYSIRWKSKGAAGTLFYTMEFSGKRTTQKMIQLDGSAGGGFQDVQMHRGMSTLTSFNKTTDAEYDVTVSKLGYEPDSAALPFADNANINFSLSTVHHRAFVIDLHNDILETTVDEIGGYEFGVRHTFHQTDIPRFREGGIDAQMISLWADPSLPSIGSYQRVLQMADTFQAQISRNPSSLAQAKTFAEIIAAHNEGKIAGIYGVEGGHAIENDLGKLTALYNLGARYMTITWNNSTSWATSAQDAQSATKGLSDFGKQVIKTMDSLGIIIDVSHTGIKTIDDILAVTKNPIIASHSGVRALRDHYRNLTDDQIIKIAQSGGVIGVVFYTSFLSAADRKSVTVDTVIKHIDYIKNLVGIDYIAVGADYDGGITAPVGLEDVSKMPALTMGLLKHGYTPQEVRKILGENYLRVFKAVCQ